MSYCPTHGRFDDYFVRGCPTCRDAEERAELDREEMRNSLSDIARTRTNLGNYDCPYCMQTSLKTGASRCPLCRGEIAAGYWTAVRAQEKADTERKAVALRVAFEQQRAMEAEAAAELLRTAPAREAAARAAAAEAKRMRRNAASDELGPIGAMLGALFGGIGTGLAGCVSWYQALMPGFNVFNGLLYGAIGGAIIGVVLGITIGQMKD
ncbi:MAG TPA: hypothetical protein VNN08_07205 [Thermoanaerobaculia bacterium]|nr:hypothetical protein [Thermoanaerobaculia bacterium]